MVKQMDRIDYMKVVDEIRRDFNLVGARLEKVYFHGDIFRFKFSKGRHMLIQLGIRVNMTSHLEVLSEPRRFGFSDRLRKELSGEILRDISLINNDRLILLRFDDFDLYIEMFGKARFVLVSDSKIVACYPCGETSSRVIKVGVDYVPPKTSQIDFSSILSSDTIGKGLGKILGRKYSDILIQSLNVNPLDKPTESLVDEVLDAFNSLLSNGKPFFNDEMFGISLSPPEGSTLTKTLNEAVDGFFVSHAEDTSTDEGESRRVTLSIEKAKALIDKYIGEYEVNTKIGKWIMMNYDFVMSLLHMSLDEIKKEIESKGLKFIGFSDDKKKVRFAIPRSQLDNL